ncbi:MAG: translation initiation factor [Thermosynechococcaceae cyanobacterium]
MKQPKPNPLERRTYREFGTELSQPATARPDVPPSQQQLKVEASRKGRKGKTVTLISGFQGSAETLAALAKQLKNQCGAGGAVKDNVIEVQGDHRDKVLQVLTELGYEAKRSGG